MIFTGLKLNKNPFRPALIGFLALFVGIQQQSLRAQEKATTAKNAGINDYYQAHLRPTLRDGFDTTGAIILGLGASLGIVAHQYDTKVKNYFGRHNYMGDNLTYFGNSLGTSYINVGVALGQMIWDRSNGLAHLEGLLGATMTVQAMKVGIRRTRPNFENERSFPSGHTATAFASSGSLSYAYGAKAAIPAYTLTSLTMLARMQDNKHWLSDVIVASSIGIFWARSSGIHHHYLSPIILKEGGGVEFTKNF